MKAAVYYETGGPDVFKYEEAPDPICRRSGIIIEVKAIGIQGGDVLHRARGELVTRPHVVGYQCAGIIREVGPDVTDRAIGQRVVATMPSGSHASMASVRADGTWLVPEGLDLGAAACVPIEFGTADECLFEFGHLKAGEMVLVQAGAGGVGLAAIQLAKRAGATVIATASSDERIERLKAFGMDQGINYRSGDFVAEVRRLTGGQGVHLAVDSVGGKVLQGSLECLAYRGRAITVGQAGRDESLIDPRGLMIGNRSLTGVFLGAEMGQDRVRRMIAKHLEDVAAGSLKAVIDRKFPLSEAGAAHVYVESRQAFGRVVLTP